MRAEGVSGRSIRLVDIVLGGPWVVISRVISPLIWVTSIKTLLRTLLRTTHEPPSIFPRSPKVHAPIEYDWAHGSRVPTPFYPMNWKPSSMCFGFGYMF